MRTLAILVLTLFAGLLLSACANGDGTVSFAGQFDPESGSVSIDFGNVSSAEVGLGDLATGAPGGTLPGTTLPGGTLPGSTLPSVTLSVPGPLGLITIDPGEEPVAFLDAIPDAERDCLVQKVGADHIEDFLSSGHEMGEDGQEVIESCLSQDTIRSVMLGMMTRDAGDIGPQAIQCLVDRLIGMDFLGAIVDENGHLEFVAMPQAAFHCLGRSSIGPHGKVC